LAFAPGGYKKGTLLLLRAWESFSIWLLTGMDIHWEILGLSGNHFKIRSL